MAANLDMSTGRAGFAFTGNRNAIWHRQGQEMAAGMSIETWAKAAGLDWEAVKVPAIASLEGVKFDHIDAAKRFRRVEERNFIVRSDNGHPLGYVSARYQPVQPLECLQFAERYFGVDDHFQLDTAGALKNGEIIWVLARYRDDLSVAGERHRMHVLMTTTFDGTGSTINKACAERVVCNNTLDVALGEKTACVRTRHNTRFDAKRVGTELATLAQGFVEFKKMGDAMAQVEMAATQTSEFFKTLLEIPFEAKKDDISTRKLNQFRALSQSYTTSVKEGAPANSAWAALQAVTRFVDHDRTSGSDDKQFMSSQLGSGKALKSQAINLLLPAIKDRVLIAA